MLYHQFVALLEEVAEMAEERNENLFFGQTCFSPQDAKDILPSLWARAGEEGRATFARALRKQQIELATAEFAS